MNNNAQDVSDATPDLPWRDISELEPSDDEHWFLRRDGFGDWVIDGPRATQNHSEDEEDGWQWFAPCESPPVRARELQRADDSEIAALFKTGDGTVIHCVGGVMVNDTYRGGTLAMRISVGVQQVQVVGERGEPAPNWCRTCGEHRNSSEAVFCSDAIHNTTPQSSAPVVGEVVAWAVDRDGDRTFPRIYATEAEADHMVFNVTVNPPAKKRAVIGYEAVKAALTAALGKGDAS